MIQTGRREYWFVTGSQHLYGEETLRQVAQDSREIVDALNAGGRLPGRLVFKPIVTTPEAIRSLCLEANSSATCAGLVLWMHTFSPSKMWIGGLTSLRKPFLHLHTQFNRDLPWDRIDMDFMNLNQSAHGDREAGFIHTRLRLNRKVVVGHWSDTEVQDRMAAWMRAATAWDDLQGARFARFGDNMRQVAVTDGDKVAAEAKFGFAVEWIRHRRSCAVHQRGVRCRGEPALRGIRGKVRRFRGAAQRRRAARISARRRLGSNWG